MGTGYPLSEQTYKDANFTVRKDADGKLLDKTRGSDLEGVEFFEEQIKKVAGMESDKERFIYTDSAKEGFTMEDMGDGDVFRSDKPYEPDKGLNTLLGNYSRVIDQYTQVINRLQKSDPDSNPDKVGILSRFQGINGGTTGGLERAYGWSKFGTPPKTLAQLAALTADFDFDEYANVLRPKVTFALLETGSVKVYDFLSCLYPNEAGKNDRILGDENLLCHVDLFDEDLNPLTGATAIGGFVTSGGEVTRYYIAFGSTIRRFDRFMRPEVHKTTVFEYTGGGTGDITSIISDGTVIFYLQGGEPRRILAMSGADTVFDIRTQDYDTDPATFTTVPNPFDEFVSCSNFNGIRKGDQIFIFVGNGATQTNNERIDLKANPTKVAGISQVIDFMVPLRRYFSPVTSPVTEPYNTARRGRNFIELQSLDAQLIGQHYNVEDDRSAIQEFPPGTFTLVPQFTGIIRAIVSGSVFHRRAIFRLDGEQLIADSKKLTGQKYRIRGTGGVFEEPSATQFGGTANCYLWNPTPIVWPPTATSPHFNALGTLIGSYTWGSLSYNSPFPGTALEVHLDFGLITLDQIHTDNFLYVIIDHNSQAPAGRRNSFQWIISPGGSQGDLGITYEAKIAG